MPTPLTYSEKQTIFADSPTLPTISEEDVRNVLDALYRRKVISLSASKTLTNDDSGLILKSTTPSNLIVTIDAGLIDGFFTKVANRSSGEITFSAGAGVTILNNLTLTQNQVASVESLGGEIYTLTSIDNVASLQAQIDVNASDINNLFFSQVTATSSGFTLADTDSQKLYKINGTGNKTITINSGLTSGLETVIMNRSSSVTVTISAGAGVTLEGNTEISPNELASIRHIGGDVYFIENIQAVEETIATNAAAIARITLDADSFSETDGPADYNSVISAQSVSGWSVGTGRVITVTNQQLTAASQFFIKNDGVTYARNYASSAWSSWTSQIDEESDGKALLNEFKTIDILQWGAVATYFASPNDFIPETRDITWSDGSDGVLTITALDSNWLKPTSWAATHVNSGETYTQSVRTIDANTGEYSSEGTVTVA